MILIILAILVVFVLVVAAFSSKPEQPSTKPQRTHYSAPEQVGYIYFIHNPKSFKDDQWIKVGMTTRSVKQRIRDFNTAVPYPFDLIMEIPTTNPHGVEQAIHEALAEFRMFKRREFFKASPEELFGKLQEAGILTLDDDEQEKELNEN